MMMTLAVAIATGTVAADTTVFDIGDFEKNFNAAKGAPRVVTILSPT